MKICAYIGMCTDAHLYSGAYSCLRVYFQVHVCVHIHGRQLGG